MLINLVVEIEVGERTSRNEIDTWLYENTAVVASIAQLVTAYTLQKKFTSVTNRRFLSTASSNMVATIPICFQPHDWIGVSSRSAGWAALIHTKSSNSDPSSMHCLAFLYMEVAAGTDPCA